MYVFTTIYSLFMKKASFQYIIVLGCRIANDGSITEILKMRLQKAYLLYKSLNKQPHILLSGGNPHGEYYEAEKMKCYLSDLGIPSDKLSVELKSNNTRENIIFSLNEIKANNYKEICIVSSCYHFLRIRIILKNLNVNNINVIGSIVPLEKIAHCMFNEMISILLLFIENEIREF